MFLFTRETSGLSGFLVPFCPELAPPHATLGWFLPQAKAHGVAPAKLKAGDRLYSLQEGLAA